MNTGRVQTIAEECGLKFVAASDDYWTEGTQEQFNMFVRRVLGSDIEIAASQEASKPEPEEVTCLRCGFVNYVCDGESPSQTQRRMKEASKPVADEPEWIDDPHDIEQGRIRNPKWKPKEPVADEREGWKLVPVEPTKAMRRAGGEYFKSTSGHWSQVAGGAFRAMLAAAPQPSKVEQEPKLYQLEVAFLRDAVKHWRKAKGVATIESALRGVQVAARPVVLEEIFKRLDALQSALGASSGD